MKKITQFVLSLLLLVCTGCTAEKQAEISEKPSATAQTTEITDIWTKDAVPVKMEYQRLYAYSASAETEDPQILGYLVQVLQTLEVGAENESVTDDYTDIMVFYFEDGDTLRIEFEHDNFVKDGKRYYVEGINSVRAILDELVE